MTDERWNIGDDVGVKVMLASGPAELVGCVESVGEHTIGVRLVTGELHAFPRHEFEPRIRPLGRLRPVADAREQRS